MSTTSITRLGDIRIHDDGDGIIHLQKDKITGLSNDTPIDSFERDPGVRQVMRSLGVSTLQGIRISPAAEFLTILSEVKQEAQEGMFESVKAKLIVLADLAKRNGFSFGPEVQGKILKDASLAAKEVGRRAARAAAAREQQVQSQRRLDFARAAEIATAREAVYTGRYNRNTGETLRLFGINVTLSPAMKATLDRMPGKIRFLIIERLSISKLDEPQLILERVIQAAETAYASGHKVEGEEIERFFADARRVVAR